MQVHALSSDRVSRRFIVGPELIASNGEVLQCDQLKDTDIGKHSSFRVWHEYRLNIDLRN